MSDYKESSIKILKGLEAVRKRPGMYIGSTDDRGLHHLVWEILDNAIDEALVGACNQIELTLFKDGSVQIKDNGRGLPTGPHPDMTNLSSAEVAFTILHAGGKFDNSAYKISGGLHGVGASVVNALSSKLILTIYRSEKIWECIFENGGKIKEKLHIIGNTNRTGTIVRFFPDKSIFINATLNFKIIKERVQESAFLFKKLKFVLDNEITKEHNEFQYQNGVSDFVNFLNQNKATITSIGCFNGKENGIEAEIAFQYCDDSSENIYSFANLIKTVEGGTHVTGFKSAFTKSFNEFARKQRWIKDKDDNFDGNDIAEGLTAVISVKVPEKIIQYEGQTKNKLFTPDVRFVVEKIVSTQFFFWLKEHKKEAEKLFNKVLTTKQAREAAKKARDEFKKLKGTKKERLLSGKLTPAQKRNPDKNELFLVEGDSAGGSAKMGRDRTYQAILPLRGKVINVEKARLIDLISNEEIATIISTVGAGIGEDFNLEECNYKKIIIMTDADTDGAHIQILLLTFFYRYMKSLIEHEMIYVALPPLYKVARPDNKGEPIYAWNETDLNAAKQKLGKVEIQRYKGLGEMNADQLWSTTMDPNHRQLIRVDIKDAIKAEQQIRILMGDDIEERKKWINANINFELEE